MKKKIIAVVGPTASGKTALSIALAKDFGGEIISCDSMQIYKGMDIGTAKPTVDEMQGIPHHLIDIINPDEEFSCADYATLAKQKIDELSEKNKLPIFCGGTGLYIDNVISNTNFSDAGKDEAFRLALAMEVELFGTEYIHKKLAEIDPESAEAIHPNNVPRVVRALEIFHTTGTTKTEWDKKSKMIDSPYDACVICLDYKDRGILYSRIDKRVDIMVEQGLVDEVKSLYCDKKIKFSTTARQAIGYKEIIDYLDGIVSLDEAIEAIKIGTRNYAKRQLTWFRRNKNAHFIYVDECRDFEEVLSVAKKTIMT